VDEYIAYWPRPATARGPPIAVRTLVHSAARIVGLLWAAGVRLPVFAAPGDPPAQARRRTRRRARDRDALWLRRLDGHILATSSSDGRWPAGPLRPGYRRVNGIESSTRLARRPQEAIAAGPVAGDVGHGTVDGSQIRG
jgi:hypothetical protein